MSNKAADATSRKLTAGILTLVLLTVCLCITTYALVMVSVSLPGNFFATGSVAVDLNGGRPVIEEHEFLFEPGMTVTKEFYIENRGTGDAYYRLYLDEVGGGLATVLQITISDGNAPLYQGTAAELTQENASAAADALRAGERRTLTISFHYPESAGNAGQDCSLSFDLCAEAVQARNNPDRRFD